MPLHLAVMGVAGTGKSCIAEALAKALNVSFIEGDDFHPSANIEKMRSGESLVDADREPWLVAINKRLGEMHEQSWVLAASLLKQRYRDWCFAGLHIDLLIYLHGTEELIVHRLQQRQENSEHFMPASLCRSQFAQLEPPPEALAIDVAQTPTAIVEQITAVLIERQLWS